MKISICIPHYNRCEYLLSVIDSIASQDYKNIEIIISDDASSDDSRFSSLPEKLLQMKDDLGAAFRHISKSLMESRDSNKET